MNPKDNTIDHKNKFPSSNHALFYRKFMYFYFHLPLKPKKGRLLFFWIPAFAGMTANAADDRNV